MRAGPGAPRWRVSRIDPSTWERESDLEGVVSMRVERDCSGDAPLIESASVEVELAALGSFRPGWHRLGFESGGAYRDIATLHLSEDSREWARGSSTATLSGRSALYPASASVLRPGAYAAKGSDGAAWAAALLAARTPAPVHAEGSFEVAEDYVFDIGSDALSAAWKVLKAAGWCIQLDARGEAWVRELPKAPALALDAARASSLGPSSARASAFPPNAFVAIDGEQVAEAVDEDALAADGFRVEACDASPALRSGETLQSFAARRLAEERAGSRGHSYTREFADGVLPFDLVVGTLPRAGLSGWLRVTAQSIDCGRSVSVEESAVLEEELS